MVRCKSILRNASTSLPPDVGPATRWTLLSATAAASSDSRTWSRGRRRLRPFVIANHCYDLIKAFSSFYQDHPIAKEENRNPPGPTWLRPLVSETVSNGMALLIDMPERM